MLILRNKGFHEFVLTILPRSLFKFLMVLSYSAFVSKLFTCKDSYSTFVYVDHFFAIVFGSSRLNLPWQSLECSVPPDASHFPFMQSSWCSTDRVSSSFFVSPVYSPHYQNLIHKHWGNSVVTPGQLLLYIFKEEKCMQCWCTNFEPKENWLKISIGWKIKV